jgi:hypothetical protein
VLDLLCGPAVPYGAQLQARGTKYKPFIEDEIDLLRGRDDGIGRDDLAWYLFDIPAGRAGLTRALLLFVLIAVLGWQLWRGERPFPVRRVTVLAGAALLSLAWNGHAAGGEGVSGAVRLPVARRLDVWGNTSRVFVETKKETLPECGSVRLSIPSPCQHALACECGASDESGELGRGLVVGPQKIGGQHERAAIYRAGNDIGVMVRMDLCFACQAQPIARCDQGKHHVMA